MLATIHSRAAWHLPTIIAALATMAAGCATEPEILTLDDVPAPDTNTAVVLLDRLVLDAPHTILGRVPLVYGVDTGRIPHTLFAAHAFGADTASLVVVAKGKKVSEFKPGGKAGKEIVEAMLGPTGNLRAPTIRSGKTVLVGFNDDVFSARLG